MRLKKKTPINAGNNFIPLSGGAVGNDNIAPQNNTGFTHEGEGSKPPISPGQSPYQTNRLTPPNNNPPPDKNVYIMPGLNRQEDNQSTDTSGKNLGGDGDNVPPKKFDGGTSPTSSISGSAANSAPPTVNPISNESSFLTNNQEPDAGFGGGLTVEQPPTTNKDFFIGQDNDTKKFEDGGTKEMLNHNVPSSTQNAHFAVNETTPAAPANGNNEQGDHNYTTTMSSFRSDGEKDRQNSDTGSTGATAARQESTFFFPTQNDSPLSANSETNSSFVENNPLNGGNEPFVFGFNEAENTTQAFTRSESNDYSNPFENLISGNSLSDEFERGSQKLNEDLGSSGSKAGKKLNLADDSTKADG